MAGEPYTNHLIHEKSPYLLQHAHNPVDWYPWGEEAFALARSQDKPIFLSIGYATCHWCHVMEKESFGNPEIGKLLNEAFVNIKVDREEHPEVDSLYMEFAQALMSSAGGWPLNVILTSDLKPFFAVTYLPPQTQRGMIGIKEFIGHIKELWQGDEKEQLIAQADKIVEIFQQAAVVTGDEMPTEAHLEASVEVMYETADTVYGGIKGEPKFPMGYQAQFLLEYGRKKNDSRALFYVELTLDMMRRGGIYDHIGGGFCRYSVDERWQVPHFEKMLYDNAILAKTYLEAWKYTKKEDYRKVCIETLNYLLREMAHPEGGFYSAEDADTEGKEGLFYTWTLAEIQQALSPSEAELFALYYAFTQGANFEGRHVLYAPLDMEEFAEKIGLPAPDVAARLSAAREALFKVRDKRTHPFKDDKVIASWNGLMIDVLARAGAALGEKRYLDAAVKAAEFIERNLWKEGHLLRRWREGEGRFAAGLDDYAALIHGLITLSEADSSGRWRTWAISLTDLLTKEFKAPQGAFYSTGSAHEILVRRCEFYDGAEPSGNGLHCENLLRLYQITQTQSYLKQAEDILKAAKKNIELFPPGACYHLIALSRYLDIKSKETA